MAITDYSNQLEYLKKYLEEHVEEVIKNELYKGNLMPQGMTGAQQHIMSASQANLAKQQLMMQYQQFANNFNSQVQQKMLAGLGLGNLQPAAPNHPPYKFYDVGEYQLVRDMGEWTLRHKPCMKNTNKWIPKNGTRHAHTVDEDGVCSGCGGVADEGLLMQLNLRKLER